MVKKSDKREKDVTKSSKKNNTEFEITFYEGVIKKRPDFVEALMALGDLYTKNGLHEKGLEIDLKLSKLRPYNPFVLYNLACSYSIIGNRAQAFETICKAIECGYDDFEYLEKDPDLSNLRSDRQFQEFWSKLKK